MPYRLGWLLILPLLACGPKDDGDGDASASDTSATAEPTSGTAPTGTDDTATTDAPTTGGACETPTSSVSPPVEIKITNTGATQLYVTISLACFSVHPFEILGPDMASQKIDLGSFEFSCSEALANECGENPGCPVAGLVKQIDSGATYTESWSGGFQVMAPLSDACADQFCGGCWIEEQAPAGQYTVRVHSSGLLENCDGPCSVCEPDPDGTCTTEGTRFEDNVSEVVFDYPAQTSVEVTIP